MPGALDDLRVLDLGGEAGTLCGRLLADLGADVILIEPPAGIPQRHAPPFVGGEADPERGIGFLHDNASKRGVTLRLGTQEGNELFRRLAVGADVVIDARGHGHLDALGVGHAALAGEQAGVIWTSITPFGLDGPSAHHAGTDFTVAAAGGFLQAMGWSGDPPLYFGGELAYAVAAQQATMGIFTALYMRDEQGAGQLLDVSLAECVAAVCAQMAVFAELDRSDQGQRPSRGPERPPGDGIYPCQDGRIVAGGGPVPHRHWREFIEWMAADGIATEWVGDDRWLDPAFRLANREAVEEAVRAFFLRHTMDELCDESIPRGFMLFPLQNAANLLQDPQLRARSWFQALDDPGRGWEVDYPGVPYRLAKTPARLRRPAPLLGEHNRQLYVDELGITPARFDELAAAGVL